MLRETNAHWIMYARLCQAAGKEDYLRPLEHIGLDWIIQTNAACAYEAIWQGLQS